MTGEDDEWAADIRATLVPKIEASGATVSLVPEGETDVKFALELGLSIMFDKPIILLVRPGVRVPERLVRVADRILDVDLDDDRDGAMAQIQCAVHELLGDQ